jgi:hypothetical protein
LVHENISITIFSSFFDYPDAFSYYLQELMMSYKHDIANPHVIEKMQKKLDQNADEENLIPDGYSFFMTGYIVPTENTVSQKKHLTEYNPLS